MKNLYSVAFFLLAVLCFNCSDETIQSKSYPYVVTKAVDVLDNGVTLTAEILDMGTLAITDYGFIVSESELPDLKNAIRIDDKVASTGEYTLTLQSGLKKGSDYYARAYAQTQTYVVYGNLISFESGGSLPPKLISFSPKEGPVGTPVEITGENLGYMVSGTTVKFGETVATIDSIFNNKLYVKVPLVSENQQVKITVEAAGMTSTSSDLFDIWFPWTRKADFPGNLLRLISSFEANGKVYVLGGLQVNPWQIKNEFWVYNPQTNTWEQKPPFPGAIRYDAQAFSINDKGYYGLGRTATEYLSDFWEYNPNTEIWSKKTNFPGAVTSQAKSFVTQNKGYVGLGYAYSTGGGYIKDIWEYNPSNSQWTKKQDFPSGRYPGFSLGTTEMGYMGMGNAGWRLDDIYEYDPLTDSWELIGNYPGMGNNDVGSFFIDGKIYMGMGSNNGSDSFSDFWEFDPVLKSWKEMNACPTKLSPFISITINGKGYIGYGWYDLTSNDQVYGRAFYEFDPTRN